MKSVTCLVSIGMSRPFYETEDELSVSVSEKDYVRLHKYDDWEEANEDIRLRIRRRILRELTWGLRNDGSIEEYETAGDVYDVDVRYPKLPENEE